MIRPHRPLAAPLALCALAALTAACNGEPPVAREDIRPVLSQVAGATDGSVGARYAGVVQARHESKLGFQASGRIVARLVDVGATVRRGQVLARLDPAQEQLHVAAATADVDAARSRVAQNRVDLERTEALLARQFASQAEVDQQRLALQQSEQQLKSALAQQQIKFNQRGYTELRADRDGVVSAVGAEAGQVVSAGQAIVTLAGAGEREVVVSIPESRVDELRTAKALRITVWAQPGREYAGVLRELAPDTDSVTRTYAARISVKDADAALRLGMTASVFAPDVDGTRAIRLPLTAVLHHGDEARVWIVDDQNGQVTARVVRLGAAQGDSVIVTQGLSGGERVVTAGGHLLHEGQKVRLPDAAAQAADASAKKASAS